MRRKVIERVSVLVAIKELGTTLATVSAEDTKTRNHPGKLRAGTVFGFFGEPPGCLKFYCYEYKFRFLSLLMCEQTETFFPKTLSL